MHELAKSFWFLLDLEVYLELNIADHDNPLQPAATFSSVLHLWTYVWQTMTDARNVITDICPRPRLKRFKVNAGSFRPIPQKKEHWWELSQQQQFEATICETSEDLLQEVPKIICIEVENVRGLRQSQRVQRLLEKVTQRAQFGPGNLSEEEEIGLRTEFAGSLPLPDD